MVTKCVYLYQYKTPENSPCAGTSSAGPWYIECRPLVHRVPAAGTSSAGRWYFNCQPLVLQLPAAGNAIASRGQCDCQPLAMRLPSPVVIPLPGHVAIPRLCLSGQPRQCAAVALFATDGKVGGDALRGVCMMGRDEGSGAGEG